MLAVEGSGAVVYGPGGANYWWAKRNKSYGKNTDAMKENAQVAKIANGRTRSSPTGMHRKVRNLLGTQDATMGVCFVGSLSISSSKDRMAEKTI